VCLSVATEVESSATVSLNGDAGKGAVADGKCCRVFSWSHKWYDDDFFELIFAIFGFPEFLCHEPHFLKWRLKTDH